MKKPLIALCMIVRNDSRSLKRALESAVAHVDEIDIGIDDRTTDPDTRRVAEEHTSSVWTFGYQDVGLSAEQWRAGLIHFANARNIGWARVAAPWIMHFDSDEFLECGIDLRQLAARYMFTKYNSLSLWRVAGELEFRDPTRLARAHLRWISPTHNQLVGCLPDVPVEARIVQDTSLRTEEDNRRRAQQRNLGIELLRPLAEQGDQHAIYHLAKHDTFHGDLDAGAGMAERYLAMTPPHGPFSDSRATLCIAVGQKYLQKADVPKGEMWATRALFDGPHPDAFALLALLAEQRGDKQVAETWTKAVEHAPTRAKMRIR